MYTHTHSYNTLINAHTLTHTHPQTHTLIYSLTHTHITHTYTHSHTLLHIHMFSHPHTHILIHTFTTLTHSHTLLHTLTHSTCTHSVVFKKTYKSRKFLHGFTALFHVSSSPVLSSALCPLSLLPRYCCADTQPSKLLEGRVHLWLTVSEGELESMSSTPESSVMGQY